MEVEKIKENDATHLELSPKVTIEEPTFEGLSPEETRKLEKKRECFVPNETQPSAVIDKKK